MTHRKRLEAIFRAGLDRVDPLRMILDRVRLEKNRLLIDMEDENYTIDLSPFDQILILGGGKASARMALAFEKILGDRLDRGLVVVKYGHGEELSKMQVIEAGHPMPDENGVLGARQILKLAEEAQERTLVLTLISGGGSALLPLPLEYGSKQRPKALSLKDKQKTTSALLACGATIQEINCVRKHLSGLKGGRFLSHLAPARSLNFILSDVVGDDLSSIASGITTADPTTFAEARAVLDKYGIANSIPPQVLEVLENGKKGIIPETLKADDPDLNLTRNILIGTNRNAVKVAGEKAKSLGYNTILLTSRITGEASEVAKLLAGIARDVAVDGLLVQPPACIISGGEPVVTLRGSGKGGRCQELALAFLLAMAGDEEILERVSFLCASTDGSDGPTDAAGGFADLELLKEAKARKVDPAVFLANNDSYHFLDSLGGLLRTGPTRTNVCDLQIILVEERGQRSEVNPASGRPDI
ncbi:MAG: glycerate kinase [Desulfohalobiaceae bacterium]|nr:glycerate kinase [Desulfohalobiaceae bacterium]